MTLAVSDAGRPVGSPRRALVLLAVATAIGSMGLAAGGTAGALLARELTGNVAGAGLPLGVLVAGSAVGALVDPASARAVMVVLGLLGVGWNAGVVDASTMLAASAAAALRPGVEGVGEFAMGVAARWPVIR